MNQRRLRRTAERSRPKCARLHARYQVSYDDGAQNWHEPTKIPIAFEWQLSSLRRARVLRREPACEDVMHAPLSNDDDDDDGIENGAEGTEGAGGW